MYQQVESGSSLTTIYHIHITDRSIVNEEKVMCAFISLYLWHIAPRILNSKNDYAIDNEISNL